MGFKLLHGQEVLDFGPFYPMLERFEAKTQKILLISSQKKDFKLYEWSAWTGPKRHFGQVQILLLQGFYSCLENPAMPLFPWNILFS